MWVICKLWIPLDLKCKINITYSCFLIALKYSQCWKNHKFQCELLNHSPYLRLLSLWRTNAYLYVSIGMYICPILYNFLSKWIIKSTFEGCKKLAEYAHFDFWFWLHSTAVFICVCLCGPYAFSHFERLFLWNTTAFH